MVAIHNRNLFLVEAGPDTLAFRRPAWLRALSGVGCATFVGLLLRLAYVSERNPWVMAPACALGVPVALAFLYLSGPDEITLDLCRRTYRQRLPWPWRRREGSFGDISSFRIFGRQRASGHGVFDLCLVLDRPGRRWWMRHPYADHPTLGSFGNLAEAQAQAQEIAATLGVPAQVITTLTRA